MKKKRRSVLIVLLAVLLPAVLSGLLIWQVYRAQRIEIAQQVIRTAWERSLSEDQPEYLQHIEMYSDFSVEKVEKGNPWVVTVRVQGVDLAGQMQNVDPAKFSADTMPEELDQYLVSQVKKSRTVDVECFVYLYKEGDGFRVQFTETFVDAMSGMVLSYARETVQEVVGGAQ